MSETFRSSTEYIHSRELMSLMVSNSQRPGEGNAAFVSSIGARAVDLGLEVSTRADPEYSDRQLLVIEVGDPQGEQKLAATSHTDVVGVEGQSWANDPWSLTEKDGIWYGRGVCDTHGSGVAMLAAAMRPETAEELKKTGSKVSIIFTYDEEAQASELSYRGAMLASGLLGSESIMPAKYYLTGEPTEFNNQIIAMRGHKGRWLSNYTVKVENPGHSAENVQNALSEACEIAHILGEFAIGIKEGGKTMSESNLFSPDHSTLQLTAADVKKEEASTTPNVARFTMDLRTIPDMHETQVKDIQELLNNIRLEHGVSLGLDVIDEYLGTLTSGSSPIVAVAEEVTRTPSQGFNGGDEGQVFRSIGKEGVTLGPGELRYAHMPNEQVPVKSILNAADIYSRIFRKVSQLK